MLMFCENFLSAKRTQGDRERLEAVRAPRPRARPSTAERHQLPLPAWLPRRRFCVGAADSDHRWPKPHMHASMPAARTARAAAARTARAAASERRERHNHALMQ